MAKRLPLTDNDGEVRELTKDDFKHFKPGAEVLPNELVKVLPKRGRPISDSPKKPVQIRLSPEIVSAFKATGRGWQTRINDALRDWLKDHRPG
jgi:uncharacterized protein (DUF4415 family)